MEDDKRKEIKIGRNGDEKQNKQKQNNQRKQKYGRMEKMMSQK